MLRSSRSAPGGRASRGLGSIRRAVVSPHNADAYSMKTFRQFPRWRELEGDRLAWEVYQYLVDTRTGLFHMNEVLEGPAALSEFRTVRDPVKCLSRGAVGAAGRAALALVADRRPHWLSK